MNGVFEKIVENTLRLNPKPVFYMNIGDAIEGNNQDTAFLKQDWNEFFAIIAPLKNRAPFHFVAGNHDIVTPASLSIYQRFAGKNYYSFNNGPDHFIVIDNSRSDSLKNMDAKQLSWLKTDLKANKNSRYTFCFYHKPLWHSSPKETIMDGLQAIFEKGGVDYVFNGHEHHYRYGERGQIKYFMIGSSGGAADKNRCDGSVFHYLVVDVTQGGARVRPVLLEGDTMAFDWVDEKKAQLFDTLKEKTFYLSPITLKYGKDSLVGQIELIAENTSDQPILFSTQWPIDSSFGWKLKPASTKISNLLPKSNKTFWFLYTAKNLVRIPELRIKTVIGKDTLELRRTPVIKREIAKGRLEQ